MTVPAPAPDDIGIPNVADLSARRIRRRTVLTAAAAVAVVLAAGAAAAYKVSLRDERDEAQREAGPKPVAATARAKKDFEATAAAALPPAAASAPARVVYTVPAVEAREDLDGAQPIPLAAVGGPAAAKNSQARPVQPPEDAPMMLAAGRQRHEAAGPAAPADSGDTGGDEVAQARQRLRGYQQQLGTLVGNLSRVAGGADGAAPPSPALGLAAPANPPPDRVLGLEKSNTPTVRAGQLRDRSLLMPKGTAFPCTLKTRVVSAVSGFVSCIVPRHVYGDDGRVLLVERGSHMDGEYRIAALKPGATRIPVLWTRLRTPHGITVDLDSPGTGALGEGGIDGAVDNRWPERIGAALLLSLIDDAVRIQIAESQSGATTVYGGTMKEGSRIAERVLESTINIPPLIYRNQGSTVGVYVARDVDFSSVYALRPVEPGR